MNWTEFFHMGGYAFYVWTAYGLMAAILLANLLLSIRRRAEVMRKFKRLQAQAGKRS
jgi:heme exporter protein D